MNSSGSEEGKKNLVGMYKQPYKHQNVECVNNDYKIRKWNLKFADDLLFP